MSRTDLLALVASGIFLIRLLPQPFRLARGGGVSGVSALAALNAVVSACAWTAYGLQADLVVVWAVSVLALVPGIWQGVLLRREIRRRDLSWTGLYIVVLLLAAALGFLGVALAGTVLVTAGPQLRIAVTQDDLRGLAPATWWVGIFDATAWGLYGLAISDPALLGYFVVLVATAVVILSRIHWTQRTAA